MPQKTFEEMNAAERQEHWSDPESLAGFFDRVQRHVDGGRCPVCDQLADPDVDQRCDRCGALSHADCVDRARGERATCLMCRFVEEWGDDTKEEVPHCHMCRHSAASGGPLLRTYAKPAKVTPWMKNGERFRKSIFGEDKFCHTLCGM